MHSVSIAYHLGTWISRHLLVPHFCLTQLSVTMTTAGVNVIRGEGLFWLMVTDVLNTLLLLFFIYAPTAS